MYNPSFEGLAYFISVLQFCKPIELWRFSLRALRAISYDASITHAAAPIVDIANIDVENDEGYDERSLYDLEQLKEDVKAMIRKRDEDGVETGEINENALKSFQDLTKLIHQIRYKSKEQLQDNGKFVQIMLPLQCVSCPLYIAEKKRLNL